METIKKIAAFFYKSANGPEPVRDMKTRKPIGSTFDSFLQDEGVYEETQAVALKRVLAWKIKQAMKKKHIVKSVMARRMRTSRSQLDRLLDPESGSITLSTLARAGRVLGREVRLGVHLRRVPTSKRYHCFRLRRISHNNGGYQHTVQTTHAKKDIVQSCS